MKKYMWSASLIFLAFAMNNSPTRGQGNGDQPEVILAVAPNYFPLALSTHTSGEVIVEVKINSEGVVTAVRAISGKAILIADSKYVARRWKFISTTDKRSTRTTRLTFVYRLVPKGTPIDQLLPLFKPPYRVEVSHVIPEK
ncbi:MAG TPA: energy transducer TonB [Pyrinomonadaceae bacterium]|nr:energy transducer TonB [Pyrinomonadaceae bacterium]